MRYLTLVFVFLLLLCIACSSIDCPIENVVYTVYGLYKPDGSVDTLYDTLTISTIRYDGSDSVLLNKSTRTTSFNLPISYNESEDVLFFELKDSLTTQYDTLYISKENEPHFESVDCSAAYFHTITGVRWAGILIDSVTINNNQVNYDLSQEHFHIYFKAHS